MRCVDLTSVYQRPILRHGPGRPYQRNLQENGTVLGHDAEMPSTSITEPRVDEQGDWESVEFEDSEWTDGELMDDARRGR
jgi:hypothetical protein